MAVGMSNAGVMDTKDVICAQIAWISDLTDCSALMYWF